MRLPFLVLTPVSVFLGAAAAWRTQAGMDMLNLILALTGALAAHLSVNLLNEYVDYRSGLDALTERTPFSGGSGALIADPGASSAVLRAGLAALGVTLVIGIFLLSRTGPAIVPIGLAGIAIIVTYSGLINRHPIACLLAPGIGVGPLMVIGTYRVLTGEFAALPVFVSLVPLLLTSNLLLLNQFPDRDADLKVGRRHFPIAYGLGASIMLYGALVALTASVIVVGVILAYLPSASSIALLPLGAAVVACGGAAKHAAHSQSLLPFLAMNALAAVLVPFVLALSLVLA